MTQVFNNLGINIKLSAVAKASDVNAVVDASVKELQRRSTAGENVRAVAEKPISIAVLNAIYNNVKKGGFSGAAPSAEKILSAGQMQTYISYVKQMSKQNVQT